LNISKGDKKLSPFFIFIIMPEQSSLSNLQKPLLAKLSKVCLDSNFLGGLPISDTDSPYDYYDDNFEILSSKARHFGENEIMDVDLEFMTKFLFDNQELLTQFFETKDKSLIDKLQIPVAKDYNLDYRVHGSSTFTEYYTTTVSCYDKNWVKESIQQQEINGSWSYYDGKSQETDYDNWEVSDVDFDDVSEIDYQPVKESLLDRLVLENTSGVVSSLDKQTLLKLKQIIESRLRSL
jgi:hypothetical protein